MNRDFDDEEVARILERATERQRTAERGALIRRGGTSLEQLEEIAGEVGIDPRWVRAAASEVALGKEAGEPETLLGVPRRIESARIVPGAVSPEGCGRLVERIRETFPTGGAAETFGAVREWSTTGIHGPNSNGGRVRIEPSDDGVRISIVQHTGGTTVVPIVIGASLLTLAVVFLVLGLVFGFNPPAVILSSIFGLTGVAAGALGLAIGGRWVDRRQREIDALADRLALIAMQDDAA